MSISCRLRLEKMLGLVYSSRKRVSSYKDSTSVLSIFAVPNNAVFWITSNLTFTLIHFMYSLKLTDTAPRAPITTGTTMTFRMRKTFAISSFNSWYFFNFSSSLSFTPVITWDGNINYDNLSLLLINKDNVWSSCLNFPITCTLYCKIPQYLEIFTFHHSLRLLFIPVVALSNSHLPQSCQWIYRASLSYLPLYSVCANLLHSLTTWATGSPLLPYILHRGDSPV